MIKNLILLAFIFIIIIVSGCSSTREVKRENEIKITKSKTLINIEAEERNYIRKNKIKELDKISFDFDENKKPVREEKLSTIKYNPEGFITETIIYNSKGDTENVYSYSYKNKIRVKTTRFKSNRNPDKYYDYAYNEYGNKIKSSRFDLNGDLDKYYIYNYDDNGNLIEEIWYDKTGRKEYSIEYDYDNNLKKIEARTYNSNGNNLFTYKFKYDANGNIVEEEKYDSDGEEVGIIQYIYKYF